MGRNGNQSSVCNMSERQIIFSGANTKMASCLLVNKVLLMPVVSGNTH